MDYHRRKWSVQRLNSTTYRLHGIQRVVPIEFCPGNFFPLRFWFAYRIIPVSKVARLPSRAITIVFRISETLFSITSCRRLRGRLDKNGCTVCQDGTVRTLYYHYGSAAWPPPPQFVVDIRYVTYRPVIALARDSWRGFRGD